MKLEPKYKEILHTSLELFRESIEVSLLSLRFMESESEIPGELTPEIIKQEKEAAQELLEDIEYLKKFLGGEEGTTEEKPKIQW